MRRNKFPVLMIASAACLSLFAADIDFRRLGEYSRRAVEAHQAKHWRAYLSHLQMAEQVFPGHPLLIYRLACAYALNGDRKSAYGYLNKVGEMGLTFPMEKEDDLQSLQGTEEWRDIQRLFKTNGKPLLKASPAFFLKEKSLLTEGIAYDPGKAKFYVGSVHQRKILCLDAAGQASDFSREADGLWGVLGMKVDAERRCLWVASSAFPQMRGYSPDDEGQAGIFRYDLASGALTGKYVLPGKPEKHVLGDLTIDAGGIVLATDSDSPCIYSITPGSTSMEVYLQHDSFQSLQGIDVSADNKTIFVADYAAGIYIIDRQKKKPVLLACPRNLALTGIDGLYRDKSSLVAIQNGITPHRVIRILMDKKMKEVASIEVLESNHPLFVEPTLGVVAGDDFYFIANSQWGLFSEKGVPAAEERLQQPAILKISLARKQ